MARSLHKLTDTAIRKVDLQPGRHSDGGGLYLNVKPGGSKSWVFMYTWAGKRRVTGIGAYPAVKLAAARQKAAQLREQVAAGIDPIAERQKGQVPTRAQCAAHFCRHDGSAMAQ